MRRGSMRWLALPSVAILALALVASAPSVAEEGGYTIPDYLRAGNFFYYNASGTEGLWFEMNITITSFNETTGSLEHVLRWKIYNGSEVVYDNVLKGVTSTYFSGGYYFFVYPEVINTSRMWNNILQWACSAYSGREQCVAYVSFEEINYTIEAYGLTVRAYNATIVLNMTDGLRYASAIIADNGLFLEVKAYWLQRGVRTHQLELVDSFTAKLRKSNYLDALTRGRTGPDPLLILVVLAIAVVLVIVRKLF